MASDHDDGEMELKGRNLNLTDLYVFREDWQTTGGSANNLVVIVNTNPRSLPRQAYYFSKLARYDIHFTRVGVSSAAVNKSTPTGRDDVILRVTFDNPTTNTLGVVDSTCYQPVTIQGIHDGTTDTAKVTTAGGPIYTTSYANSKLDTLTVSTLTLGSSTLSFFAGIRQDPFFFDVSRYFIIRNTLATTGTTTGWAGVTTGTATDFTTNFNINGMALRVPISYLQSSAAETVFDVWATISVAE